MSRDHLVPERLLRAQVRQFDDQGQLSDWECIFVTGSPGCGKSQVADILAREVRDKNGAIVIEASDPRLAAELEKLAKSKDRERGLRRLARLLSSLRPDLGGTATAVEALSDALFRAFQRRQQPVLILADNLHVRRELRNTLAALLAAREFWGFRYLLVGRNLGDLLPPAGGIFVDLYPWSRDEAIEIMQSWVLREHRAGSWRY